MRQSFSVMLAHQLRRKAERWEGSTKMKAIFTFSSYHLWNQNTFPGCVKKNLCLHCVSQRLRKREWHGTPAPDSSEISNMEVSTNPKMQSGRQTKKGIIPCSMTSWLGVEIGGHRPLFEPKCIKLEWWKRFCLASGDLYKAFGFFAICSISPMQDAPTVDYVARFGCGNQNVSENLDFRYC